jgi:hypothetical protein
MKKVIKDAKSVYAKRLWIEEFGSLADALNYAMGNTSPKSSNTGDESFTNTKDLRSAVDLGIRGYDEVRPMVERMFTEMESQLADRLEVAFQTQFALTGAVVDVGRYLGGEPECMIDFVPEPSSRMGRVVKILVSGVASASIPTEHIVKRGVAVCALVDCIHKLGMGVEVYVETPVNDKGINSPSGSVFTSLVKIHSSEQMLDINNLMFAVCHPSMLRRIHFSIAEQTECEWMLAQIPPRGYGYGCPSALECADRIGADVKVEMLQSGSGDIIRKSVDWVVSTLSGLGVL